jgi:hypothetical protein
MNYIMVSAFVGTPRPLLDSYFKRRHFDFFQRSRSDSFFYGSKFSLASYPLL